MLDYNMEERGERSLYDHLYRCIRDDIAAGTIGAGEKLPSKRSLAEHLGVSVVTVEGAYAQLVAEGYVRSRPRSGFFAAALPDEVQRSGLYRAQRQLGKAQEPAQPDRDDAVGGTGSKPFAADDAARLWAKTLKAVLAEEPEDEVFLPTAPEGSPRLRHAIAAHLRGSRGMEVDPSCIVVGAGAQLLDNMIVQLLGHERVYAVEDPGYLRLTQIYRAMGCAVRHIPLDEEGPVTAELDARHADVLHLMPSHQFPTGLVTSVSRRYELLGWASAVPGRYLVEDDYDCEFRLAGRPVPALASIDAVGRVIYTNTFSRSLGAELRLAYMVLPPELMERFSSELGFYSSTVGSVDQAALAHLLESGDYERHVARVRKRQRDCRDALVGALKASAAAGRVHIEQADAGLHFVLAAETGRTEAEVALAVKAKGVELDPLSRYAWCPQNGSRPDGLRRFVVRFGDIAPQDAERAASVVAEALR